MPPPYRPRHPRPQPHQLRHRLRPPLPGPHRPIGRTHHPEPLDLVRIGRMRRGVLHPRERGATQLQGMRFGHLQGANDLVRIQFERERGHDQRGGVAELRA